MLIGNAENLMKSVLATLRAAESASVKVCFVIIHLPVRKSEPFL